MIGKNGKNRFRSSGFHSFVHFFFFDYKRDNPGASQFISFFYREVPMAGSNHHLPQRIHCQKGISADFQNSVLVCYQFDLAFFHISSMHGISCTDFIQNISALIFMKNAFFLFPHKKMFFSNRKEQRNVLFFHNMSFGKQNAFLLILYNLCNIMTQYLTYCILCFH